MRWSAFGLLAVALLLAGCSGPPSAQPAEAATETAGVLQGVAVDEALRPIAGVDVRAALAGGAPSTAVTGEDGRFRLAGLAPGTWAVEASKAAHLSAYTLAQVEAGVDEPPFLRLVLPVQADELPFVVAIAWHGFVGCAFTYGNLCSAPAQGGFDLIGDQSAHLFWDEYVALGRSPDLIQGEAVWEATLPTSGELKPIYGWSEPEAWRQFQYQGTFFGESTPSPSFHRLTQAELVAAKVGTDAGLVVEFYSGGDTTSPTGLTVNQPVDLYLHNFYGYLPPDDWRFALHGPPPAPPS